MANARDLGRNLKGTTTTNIYFMTLAVGGVNGQNCTTGAKGASKNPYCAVKLTQSGLQ